MAMNLVATTADLLVDLKAVWWAAWMVEMRAASTALTKVASRVCQMAARMVDLRVVQLVEVELLSADQMVVERAA